MGPCARSRRGCSRGLGTSPSQADPPRIVRVLPGRRCRVGTRRQALPLPSQAELLNHVRSAVAAKLPKSWPDLSRVPGQLEPPVQLGVVSVLAVVFTVLLWKIFWKKDVTATPKAPDGEDQAGPSGGLPAEGGKGFRPVGWATGALFGEFSSLSWLLILVTLLLGSSFPKNLLEDLLMCKEMMVKVNSSLFLSQ